MSLYQVKKSLLIPSERFFIELALNNKDDFIFIINTTGHSTVEMVNYYDIRDSLKHKPIHSL
jgi:hypothetical protein